MTTIRSGGPVGGIPARLADTDGHIPFYLIDSNGTGRVTKAELQNALKRIFPSLSGAQCRSISDEAFAAVKREGMVMDRDGWAVAEEVVLDSAKACATANAMQAGTNPSGWVNATGAPATGTSLVGQNHIPLLPVAAAAGAYLPHALNGFNPYQYPVSLPAGAETPGTKMAKGAGRGMLGFLKMIPGVGNIINGVDFVRDIAQMVTGNRREGFLKNAADLLFHGAGMFIPQVGGMYDMAQGAMRVTSAGMQSMMNPAMMNPAMMNQPWAQLPAYNFNSAGLPALHNMRHAAAMEALNR